MIGVMMAVTLSGLAPGDLDPALGGFWLSADKESAVVFHGCGGGALCADIRWMKAKTGHDGRRLVDEKNPDPAKRTRPLCGLPIISDLKTDGPGHWSGGHVYSAGDGRSYGLNMELVSPTKLKMRGYIGAPMLGQTFYLERAQGLTLCEP